MYKTLVLTVDEVFLKGKNRNLYFKSFRSHAEEILRTYHGNQFQSKNENHRLVFNSQIEFSQETITALLKVAGLHSIIPSITIERNYESILPGVIEELKRWPKLPSTFKVKTTRPDKTFPHRSKDINETLGHEIPKVFPQLKVDVKNPEILIELKITAEKIYLSTQKWYGMGGQPLGRTGHIITLISGGFDSPVASYLMSKRGCTQTFAFFYAYPFVGEDVCEKIKKLCSQLSTYQRNARLYIIPFGELQKKLSKLCREEYRTVFFRKLMVDASNLLAYQLRASAILTGDSLGQVSSQTLKNIAAIDADSKKPILRPLIGYNKNEIINLSRIIKTHDISVIPHDDACGLFAPKHPIIRPDRYYWGQFFRDNDFSMDLEQCIQNAQIFEYNVKGEERFVR